MGTAVRSRVRTRRTPSRGDLHAFVREAVREELRSLIGDPDYGRTLRAGVASRLARSQRSKRVGKVRSARVIITRLGLRV